LFVQKEAAEYHTARLNLWRSKPTVWVNIRGISREFIVDSGSNVSLIQPGICRSEVRPSNTTSFGVTGDVLDILGKQDVQFSVNIWNYGHTFCVCSLPKEADGILGMDFLSEMNASLDVGRQELRLRKRPMSNRGFVSRRTRRANSETDYAALTVFPNRDCKQRRSERTPKPRSKAERERKFVRDVECKARSRTRPNRALSRHAQVATAERQSGDKTPCARKDVSESGGQVEGRRSVRYSHTHHRLRTRSGAQKTATRKFRETWTHRNGEDSFAKHTALRTRTQHPIARRLRRRTSEVKYTNC